MIYNNVTELVGNTPIVRYSENILLKLEFFNPSNSIKDRASLYMLKEAMKSGLVDDSTVIIEPTSGNTGIGLAMCCAAMGLKLIVVMPENMSDERKKVIKAYGAELVLTPASDGMKGSVDKAEELKQKYPNSFIPMQFSNSANPLSHIETTVPEIWKQTEGQVDIVVAGVGTGGTIIGLAKGLKRLNPNILAFAVEPSESPLLSQGVAGPHKIQGIGANFIPSIYDETVIDGVLTIEGSRAIGEAKLLASQKGILCGISSGANVAAAKDLAQKYPDKTILTVVPDLGERYLSGELFNV